MEWESFFGIYINSFGIVMNDFGFFFGCFCVYFNQVIEGGVLVRDVIENGVICSFGFFYGECQYV